MLVARGAVGSVRNMKVAASKGRYMAGTGAVQMPCLEVAGGCRGVPRVVWWWRLQACEPLVCQTNSMRFAVVLNIKRPNNDTMLSD